MVKPTKQFMTNTRIIDRHFLMHTKYLLQGNCLAEELHMVSLISIYDGHKLRKVFGWGDSKIIMLAHLLWGGEG